MSDPAPAPTPTPAPTPCPGKFSLYDELKTIVLGIALGIVIAGHAGVLPAPGPIPAPIPAPAPLPAPPVPPGPSPVQHTGTLFLSYIETTDTSPAAAAIRDAAVGTDWKGLNCRWRSYTQGQASLAATGLTKYADTLPAVVIQELPTGVDPDAATLPSSPVIGVIKAPASFDAIVAQIKVLRGGN